MRNSGLKKILAIVLGLSLVMLLAVCSGTLLNRNAIVKAATGKKSEPSGEINALLWLSSYPEALDQILSSFNKKYPKVKVNVQMMSGNTTSENLEPRVAAGNMPDVCSVDIGEWYYTNADKGYFRDLADTPAWKNQLSSIKAQWTSPKGVKYGVSYGVAAMFIFYNKTLFAKAGITKLPTNWDEFLATCAALKKAGITPISWPGGFANMFGHTFISAGVANNIYRSNKGLVKQVLYGNYDYGTPEWVNVYQKNVDLVNKGYVNKGYMSTDFAESIRLFNEGEVAMTYQGSWSCGDLLKNENVDMFLPPWNEKGKEMVGNMAGETGFGIGKSANVNVKLAKLFFNYIAYENYAKFQNFTKTIPIYPAAVCPGTKVDPRLKTAFEKMTALKLNCPLAFQMFPSPVYTAMLQLSQDVLTGAKKPADIGSVLNPIQKEYLASKTK